MAPGEGRLGEIKGIVFVSVSHVSPLQMKNCRGVVSGNLAGQSEVCCVIFFFCGRFRVTYENVIYTVLVHNSINIPRVEVFVPHADDMLVLLLRGFTCKCICDVVPRPEYPFRSDDQMSINKTWSDKLRVFSTSFCENRPNANSFCYGIVAQSQCFRRNVEICIRVLYISMSSFCNLEKNVLFIVHISWYYCPNSRKYM